MKTITYDETKYKLVPVEPSIAACINGADAVGNAVDGYQCASIYRAMLSAAPEPAHCEAGPDYCGQCLKEQPLKPLTDEKAAFVQWLRATHKRVYSREEAEQMWEYGHVAALAWQHRAALYTATQPAQQPLTDEQVEALYNAAPAKRDGWKAFARAIEAAHGIGEKK